MDCKEIWREFVDWTNESQGGAKWQTFVNVGMTYKFRKYAVNILTIWAI
jgi:hypothetical protein